METRIETTIQQDGTLTLKDLPFQAGETVEVIVVPKPTPQNGDKYPLRGTAVIYADPFEPVAAGDWVASA